MLCIAMGSGGILLNMTGNEHLSARVTGIGLITNIILNGLLIPIFGINGAAIATIFSLLFTRVLMAVLVYKKFNINSTAFG